MISKDMFCYFMFFSSSGDYNIGGLLLLNKDECYVVWERIEGSFRKRANGKT